MPTTLSERKIARFDFSVLIRTTDGKLKVRNSKSILRAGFLTGREIHKFGAVAHEIAKLSSFKQMDKSRNNKVVLKKIGNPFGVTGIGFLAGNSFDVFGVGKHPH